MKYIKKINEFLDNSFEIKIKELESIIESVCVFYSNPEQKENHPAYKEFISLGEIAIPFLIEKMDTDYKHVWLNALNIITGIDPINEDDRGNIDAIAKTWKKWALDNGY